MEEFWNSLFLALFKVLPFMVTLIIGASVWSFGSTGIFVGGGKIDENLRKILRTVGAILFWFGFATTVVTVSSLFIEFMKPYKLYVLNALGILSTLFSSPLLWIILVITGLFFVSFSYLQKRQIEKGFNAKTEKVLDYPFDCRGEKLYKTAGILVKNTGIGDMNCVAKLVKVEKIIKEKKVKSIPIAIKELNPNGYDLQWDNGNSNCVITKQKPRKIDLANAYDDYENYFRKGRLCFENGYTSPLETGAYFIEVDIFRISGNKQIKINTVEGILGVSLYFNHFPSPVSGDGVHIVWLEDKEEKRSISKKTGKKKVGK
jgi:hypothetical protein